MTQDPAKPLEPNSSDQPTDSQPTNASSTPDASTPEASPNLPLTEEAAVSEAIDPVPQAIEPSSPQEGISDLPSEPQAGETANLPTGTPTPAGEPIESVAMTDATQHSSSGESSNASKEPSPAVSSARSDKTPSAKSDQTPTGSTSAIGQIFKQIWAVILALTPVVVGIGRSLWRLLLIVAKGIREGWKLLLPRIRAVLPEGWNKLPDWAITTVAVALLVFIVWITTLLLPTRAPAQPSDRPPAISTPSQPQPESPDPALIARIQEQVIEVADKYTEGLIQSVQTNFGGSELTVNLSDGWYDLPSNRQDTLANDILNRSRQLDFESVKLMDGDGEVLARSPVVGTRMVVYRRGRVETRNFTSIREGGA